jgi:hypothetical protein
MAKLVWTNAPRRRWRTANPVARHSKGRATIPDMDSQALVRSADACDWSTSGGDAMKRAFLQHSIQLFYTDSSVYTCLHYCRVFVFTTSTCSKKWNYQSGLRVFSKRWPQIGNSLPIMYPTWNGVFLLQATGKRGASCRCLQSSQRSLYVHSHAISRYNIQTLCPPH